MTGFSIDEVMTGTHKFEDWCAVDDTGNLPLKFSVVWGHDDVSKYLDFRSEGFMLADLKGNVTVGGLCDREYCEGTFKLDYLGEHKITYDFDFHADGCYFSLHGEKVNIKPWNLLTSHTTCFCTIINQETNELISRGVVYFEWKTLLKFLLSFRLK